jgi:alpha-L-fucosidase 2
MKAPQGPAPAGRLAQVGVGRRPGTRLHDARCLRAHRRRGAPAAAAFIPTARAVLRFFDHYYRTNEAGKRFVMHPSHGRSRPGGTAPTPCPSWPACAPFHRAPAGPASETVGIPRRIAPTGRPSSPSCRTCRLARRRPAPPSRPPSDSPPSATCENPELYGVFPFRLCSFNRTNAELGRERAHSTAGTAARAGWRQDDIFMAYLGLTARSAQEELVTSRAKHPPSRRFPLSRPSGDPTTTGCPTRTTAAC